MWGASVNTRAAISQHLGIAPHRNLSVGPPDGRKPWERQALPGPLWARRSITTPTLGPPLRLCGFAGLPAHLRFCEARRYPFRGYVFPGLWGVRPPGAGREGPRSLGRLCEAGIGGTHQPGRHGHPGPGEARARVRPPSRHPEKRPSAAGGSASPQPETGWSASAGNRRRRPWRSCRFTVMWGRRRTPRAISRPGLAISFMSMSMTAACPSVRC